MAGVALEVLSRIGADECESDASLWTFGRAVSVISRIGSDQIQVVPSFGRAIASNSIVGSDAISLKPTFGRGLGVESVVGADEFILTTLSSLVVHPPVAQLFILKNGREEPLNNNILTRNDSYAFNLYVQGDRVASTVNGTMNVTLTAKVSPTNDDTHAIFRKTLFNGGVKFLGVQDVVSYAGKTRAATYQVRLFPKDTESLTQDTWLYYDLQLDDGLPNGERYTVESGKFRVSFDLYRGVGGT